MDELFDWPTSIAQSISMCKLGRKDVSDESAAMVQNVKRHMIDGVDVVTDDSGVECPRWAMQPTELALNSYCCLGLPESSFPRVRFHRSCDVGKTQQEVFVGIAIQVDNSETCVLGDTLERLPSTAQSTIAKMKPKEHWRREEKHEGYQDSRSYLMENRQWCYPPKAKSICLVHGY